MKLIIAEKPSVAKQLRDALEPLARSGGKPGLFVGYKYTFCCALGHLFTYKMPEEINKDYEKWTLDNIPFDLPKEIPLKLSDKIRKDYFAVLEKEITSNKYDEIIIATDPDREGQGIYERIRSMIKNFPNIPETRIWIDEWTPELLVQAVNNRKPNSNYQGLKDAAECRAVEDYLVGLTSTRALTCKYGGFGNVISAGPVQTPTLYMIVKRENEINNFKSETYYNLYLIIKADDGSEVIMSHNSDEHLSETDVKNLKTKLLNSIANNQCYIEKETKKTQKRPLKLPNATDIQKELNILYGFDADKSSNLLQTLYQDKGLTTYPGTKAQEISQSASKMALKPLQNILASQKDLADIPFGEEIAQAVEQNSSISSNCVTSEGLAHEAITPVFGSIKPNTITSLTQDERRCYELVVRRYIQAFYPNAVFADTLLKTTIDGELFQTKGRVIEELGFMAITGAPKDTILPNVSEGYHDVVDFQPKEVITTPPPRYTTATILEAMEKASRFVDNKHYADILKDKKVNGIGTDRTRNIILKSLELRHYYTIKGKSLIPSQKAMQLFEVLPENTHLDTPAFKARMEEELEWVEKGEMSKEDYLNKVYKEVEDMVEAIRNDTISRTISDGSTTFEEVCPNCGQPLTSTDKVVKCKQCNFIIYKNFKGKKLTDSQIKTLLQGKTTSVIKGFEKKDGGTFDAKLKLDENNQISFVFEDKDNIIGKCPRCGGDIIESIKGYKCTSPDYSFMIWKNNALLQSQKKKLTTKMVKDLLNNDKMLVKGFTSPKKGTKYDAYLSLEDTGKYVNIKMSFK